MTFRFSRACVTGLVIALVAVMADPAHAVITYSMSPANLQILAGQTGSALITVTSDDGGGNPLLVTNTDVAMAISPLGGGSVEIQSIDGNPSGSIYSSPTAVLPPLPSSQGFVSVFDISDPTGPGFAANGNIFEVVFSAANASPGQNFDVDLNDAGNSNAGNGSQDFTNQLVVNPASISVVPEPSSFLLLALVGGIVGAYKLRKKFLKTS